MFDFLNVSEIKNVDSQSMVNGYCPKCGQKVIFSKIKDSKDLQCYNAYGHGYKILGQRHCPDMNCFAHIFFIIHVNSGGYSDIEIFPNKFPIQSLDFNLLPGGIKETLNEALECYNHSCYKASAIMIRRTLEEICEECSVKGDNLHQKIEKLKSKINISEDLYNAFVELKFLGNDAAHIESKHFEKIKNEEIEVAITLLIEILRALYQHKNILDSLKALKKKELQK